MSQIITEPLRLLDLEVKRKDVVTLKSPGTSHLRIGAAKDLELVTDIARSGRKSGELPPSRSSLQIAPGLLSS